MGAVVPGAPRLVVPVAHHTGGRAAVALDLPRAPQIVCYEALDAVLFKLNEHRLGMIGVGREVWG